MPAIKIRTTVAFDARLLAAIDHAVESGQARNRTDFLASAAAHELERSHRAEIDAEFSGMATDQEYQRMALEVDRELTSPSWEAMRLGEGEP